MLCTAGESNFTAVRQLECICAMTSHFISEMYVSAVDSHISAVSSARLGDGFRALNSSPDQFFQISRMKVDANLWGTSLWFANELWRNTSSN